MTKITKTYLVVGALAGWFLNRFMTKGVAVNLTGLGWGRCHSRPAPRGTERTVHCSGDWECKQYLGPEYTCWFGDCVPKEEATALGRSNVHMPPPGGDEEPNGGRNGQEDGGKVVNGDWWRKPPGDGRNPRGFPGIHRTRHERLCLSDRECKDAFGPRYSCWQGQCVSSGLVFSGLGAWNPPTHPGFTGNRLRY